MVQKLLSTTENFQERWQILKFVISYILRYLIFLFQKSGKLLTVQCRVHRPLERYWDVTNKKRNKRLIRKFKHLGRMARGIVSEKLEFQLKCCSLKPSIIKSRSAKELVKALDSFFRTQLISLSRNAGAAPEKLVPQRRIGRRILLTAPL